ncbi:hypothetical protein GH714_004380 [Hevea brasiliensis]|uniref:Pinin/SDK/MemA protein domain-containing protein n=1 Tax=Hevea brasiliensis TaxID=3981 RepID=A0A6A6KYW0_HEVBR|nr:hypothetical protein GH714_004380 [Hevea brasiliensis]
MQNKSSSHQNNGNNTSAASLRDERGWKGEDQDKSLAENVTSIASDPKFRVAVAAAITSLINKEKGTPHAMRPSLVPIKEGEITERLRDPRGLRRGGLSGAGPRNFAANGVRQRGVVRPADRNDAEDQPPAKRRLLSAVVKVEDGEIVEDPTVSTDLKNKQSAEEDVGAAIRIKVMENQPFYSRVEAELPVAEPVPRLLPKDEDPSLVSRNKRMLGQLLGTLEKFRKEDMKLSGTEAYKQRSNALLRTLRARVAAKTEQKKLELLFLRWSEHHKKLCNFIRQSLIYYLPNKALDEDATLLEHRKEQTFSEWKATRREELSEHQKQIAEQYLGNVEKELERWQNARKARRPNNDANLQESMDKELDTHRLEHGPKTRKIPGGSNNEDEDDVEDINVGEDDMMDDVLVVDDNSRRGDEAAKPEAGTTSPHHDNIDQ